MKRAQDTGAAWIEIRRDALRQNVVALRTLLPPRCELMPALKANAYGHGALPVARELNCLACGRFAWLRWGKEWNCGRAAWKD